MEERYDLGESKHSVRELCPVLLDAHGNVIDGYHRLRADPGWRTETLEHIRTPTQLVLARIIANTHRRAVSREEREEQVNEFAKCLVEDENVSREGLIPTIADLTTFSDRYVRGRYLQGSQEVAVHESDRPRLQGRQDEELQGRTQADDMGYYGSHDGGGLPGAAVTLPHAEP
jgi:hypothetical protein